jgi:DNA polymerase I-like protein with 3'-5' exonuclease and polymerase domains
MLERCIGDVAIQEKIYDHLRSVELRGFSLKSIDLEHKSQKIISQMRRDGVYLDTSKILNLYATTKNRADFLEQEIQNVFPVRTKLVTEYNPKEKKNGGWMLNTVGGLDVGDVGGPFSSFCYESFNPSSPVQRVKRLLELGWVPTEFTKPSKTHPNGQPKFTEDSLETLPENAPKEIRLIGTYLMTRSRQALANELLELQDKDGYIHGYIDILGAGTHRMSSNSPNLQNIPKPKVLKDGSILPFQGS